MGTTARPIIWFLAVSSFILHPSSFVMADGGAVRLRQCAGGYQITVFSAPTPLCAGPVDVSVLVLDAATGDHVPEVRVTVRLTARANGAVLDHPATTAAATNKLFRAAVFDLPEPGWWDAEVLIEGPHGPALVRFAMEADTPPPPWLELWPWFAWPALAVALFGIHRKLGQRRANVARKTAKAPMGQGCR